MFTVCLSVSPALNKAGTCNKHQNIKQRYIYHILKNIFLCIWLHLLKYLHQTCETNKISCCFMMTGIAATLSRDTLTSSYPTQAIPPIRTCHPHLKNSSHPRYLSALARCSSHPHFYPTQAIRTSHPHLKKLKPPALPSAFQ